MSLRERERASTRRYRRGRNQRCKSLPVINKTGHNSRMVRTALRTTVTEQQSGKCSAFFNTYYAFFIIRSVYSTFRTFQYISVQYTFSTVLYLQYIVPSMHHTFSTRYLQYIIPSLYYTFSTLYLHYIIPSTYYTFIQYTIPSEHYTFSTAYLQYTIPSMHYTFSTVYLQSEDRRPDG